MTDIDPTITVEFLAALPEDLREQLAPPGRTPTKALQYTLAVAVHDKGWTIGQLVHQATRDLATAGNVAALVHDRIKIASTIAPPHTAKPGISKGIPFCSDECRENAGWILNADGRPAGRCPCRTAA